MINNYMTTGNKATENSTHPLFAIDNVTIYFLKDIIGRRKSYVHNDDVKNLHVP